MLVAAILTPAARAAAQPTVGGYDASSRILDRMGEHHVKLIGAVELRRGDIEIYAD